MTKAVPRAAIAILAIVCAPTVALAQQSVTSVLSFLLTNRSIATGNPDADEAAAAATRDTISQLLLLELTTMPTLSSSAGFTYRVDRDLGGAIIRSSESFGPSFVERSLTTGTVRPAFGVAYQDSAYDAIDGRALSDGTLVATAGRLVGESQPFDVETVALNLRTRTLTLSANVGVSDRVDVSAALPLVRLTLSGHRTDTLRGVPFLQAVGHAEASGVGDLVVRAKYNAFRSGGSGVALGGELRLPTGEEENLLGAGVASFKPRVIGSFEYSKVSVHGQAGYLFSDLSKELDYGGAVAVVAHPRVTVIGELLGRRLPSGGRIVETVAAHPTLVGVETIRLTGVEEATHRAMLVGSVKWNVADTWLISGSIQRHLTSAGLTADVIPAVVVEYSFTR